MLRAKSLDDLEDELARIDDLTARQAWLLRAINRLTGSDFSAINLTDSLGRVIGGNAWPMTAKRGGQLAKYAPTLNAVLVASPLHDMLWGFGPNRAFAYPEPMFKSSQAYRLVYRHMGINHLGVYLFPPVGERRVLVGISSRRTRFSEHDLQALEKICQRFRDVLIDLVAPSGEAYAKTSVAADHTTEFDSSFQTTSMPVFLQSRLVFFFGPMQADDAERSRLPQMLTSALRKFLDGDLRSVMPLDGGRSFCLTKRQAGRTLCLLVQFDETGAGRLTCYEDLAQLEYLRRIRKACEALKRDRYAVLSACIAIIDGANAVTEILRSACLAALKPSSGRRIVGSAKRVLASVPVGF